MRIAHVSLTLALTCLPAAAGTWIVDDDGGPGVDFTDIAPAIAAAAPGDSLLILAGIYSAFDLDKPLALVAQPGAKVQGGPGCRVHDLPAGAVVTVSGLAFGGLNWPIVEDCAGTVVLDGLELLSSGMLVDASTDVRMRDCTVGRGLQVEVWLPLLLGFHLACPVNRSEKRTFWRHGVQPLGRGSPSSEGTSRERCRQI